MLVTKISEVRAVLRISALDEDASLPDIASAEQTYILPWIGDGLYNSLHTAYVSDPQNLSPAQSKLLHIIQKAVCAFAYYDDLGMIHAQITDAGVRRSTTDNMPAAFRWEFDGVKDALLSRGYQAIESMLALLEANPADYPEWGTSAGFQRRQMFLVKNGYDFSSLFTLFQPLRTYNSLQGCMTDIEKLYVAPMIGEEFFTSLKSLTQPTALEGSLIADLKIGIANLTIMVAAEKLPVKISDAGFTVIHPSAQTDNAQQAPDNNLAMLINSCRRDGNAFLLKAKSLLQDNASPTLFTLYYNSPQYKKPTTPSQDRNSKRKIFGL